VKGVNYSYNQAGIAQLVEHKLPKLGVAGSNPVARSKKIMKDGLDVTVQAFFIRTSPCRSFAALVILALRNGRFQEPDKIVSKDKKGL
jgi:hypothetical protein